MYMTDEQFDKGLRAAVEEKGMEHIGLPMKYGSARSPRAMTWITSTRKAVDTATA